MQTDIVIEQTRQWIENVVVGLNFCPFAKRELRRDAVRFTVNGSGEMGDALQQLIDECGFLDANPDTETTLLIHPQVLGDFLDYNDFLEIADALVADLGYEGVLQVASFHPQYRFADTEPDDVTNCTNRSPYPTLHLLRESSIERAVAALRERFGLGAHPHAILFSRRRFKQRGAHYFAQTVATVHG